MNEKRFSRENGLSVLLELAARAILFQWLVVPEYSRKFSEYSVKISIAKAVNFNQ